jgi:hypothetical protein
MEALDLATGLGVIGVRVLVVDAEVKQLGLERGVAVAIGGREDAAIEFPMDVKSPRAT